MRINPFAILGTYLSNIRSVKKRGPAQASAYSAGSDQVELSEMTHEVAHLSQMVSTEPEVRADRVSEVSKKIADGKHHPTEKEVAESLVKAAVMDDLL
jgi:flagellar biosynthesis anti-sigma factor FlgM